MFNSKTIHKIAGTAAIACLISTMACSSSKDDPKVESSVLTIGAFNMSVSPYQTINDSFQTIAIAYYLKNELLIEKYVTPDDNPTWEFISTVNGNPTNVTFLFNSYNMSAWQWYASVPTAGQYSIRAKATIGSQIAISDPVIFTISP
jgi:hypothetical protein